MLIMPGVYTERSTCRCQREVLSIHQHEDPSGSRLKSVVFSIMTSDKQPA